MKKYFGWIVTILLVSSFMFVFLGCNEPNQKFPIDNSSEDQPDENEQLPNEDEQQSVEDSNKTYLEIKNNSQFDVNIYFDSSLDFLWGKVSVGNTVRKEVNLDEISNRIYVEYEYKIGTVTIPYFDSTNIGCVKTIPIREKEDNKLEISELEALNFNNKAYLILQNETSDYVFIEESLPDDNLHELNQNSSDEYWINPKTDAVYDVSEINLDSCYVVNGNNMLNFSIGELKLGRVYIMQYDGKDISVLSIDFGLNPKDDRGLPLYVISSAEDLKKLSNYNDVNATFELSCNIDGKNTVWNPIDTFKGTFIGNGFSISNFVINSESELGEEEKKHNIQEIGAGVTYYQPAYCGFFYKNNGVIKNIFFKNITVNAYFEYQTDNWRHVYIGTIAGHNYGTIKNVHLENININSTLNHQKNQNGTPLQMNIVGGFVGENYGEMSYCSIRNSEISASTSAKKNRCYTATYAGGICGELYHDVDNILVISTYVDSHSEGGFMDGWLTKDDLNDGILKSYAGNILGYGNNRDVTRIISYKGGQTATTYAISNNPTEEKRTGFLDASDNSNINYGYAINNLEQLKSYPILEWENWSILGDAPENYMDFLY